MTRRILLAAAVMLIAAAPAASPRLGAATLFAPDVVSGPLNDFAPAFSPDGQRLLFTRGPGGGVSSIFESHRAGKGWAPPRTAVFSGAWVDLETAWAPEGGYVVFASNRPAGAGGAAVVAHYYGQAQVGGNLWRVDALGGRWSAPRRLGDRINSGASVWTPALARGDVLYFMATDPRTGRFRLHRATRATSDTPEVGDLGFSTGDHNDVDPYVTPDEGLLVFSSDRGGQVQGDRPGPERLFVVFEPRAAAPLVCPLRIQGWEDPAISMVEARLSGDRRTLYFASRRLAHGSSEAARGAWDSGKANIWTTPFGPSLWRYPGASPACAAQANPKPGG